MFFTGFLRFLRLPGGSDLMNLDESGMDLGWIWDESGMDLRRRAGSLKKTLSGFQDSLLSLMFS